MLAAALVLAGARGAIARCGTDPDDARAIVAARAEVDAACTCTGAASHPLYVRCAVGVAKRRVASGALPKRCTAAVKRCAAKSVCGKRRAVTCCLTRKGKTRCRIKKKAAKCLAKGGCVGLFASCCDACTATGCRGLPTTTTSTTAPPTTATSSTSSTTTTSTTTSTTTTTFGEPQTCEQFAAPEPPDEPLPCGGTVACLLDPAGDTDGFTFTLPEGAAVAISIGGTLNPCWQLIGPGGPLIQPQCTALNSLNGLPAGLYSITVTENPPPSMTDYALSLEGVSAAYHCGTPMTQASETFIDSLTPPGDTDAYNFTAVAGQIATISINGDHNPCWLLFGPDGVPVMSQRCRTDGAVATPALAAGVHTIVAHELVGQTSDYTLGVTIVP
jgi:hypothetical protein